MANVVVVGAQWGDEGKGKIVDWLSERAACPDMSPIMSLSEAERLAEAEGLRLVRSSNASGFEGV